MLTVDIAKSVYRISYNGFKTSVGMGSTAGRLVSLGTASRGGKIRIPRFFTSQLKVPDDWRYVLRFNRNRWVLAPISFNPCPACNGSIKFIVLLLESPHRHEYENYFSPQNMIPIRPANGNSGTRIDNYFISELLQNPITCHKLTTLVPLNLSRYIRNNTIQNSLNSNHEYIVVVMNPVQFQASLGSLYKGSLDHKIRDYVWRYLYITCNLESDFVTRLNNLGSPNKIELVLNGCTGNSISVSGNSTSSLKGHVQNTLQNHFPTVKRLNVDHPSCWQSGTYAYY